MTPCRYSLLLVSLCGAWMASCRGAPAGGAGSERRFTAEQLKAKFAWDLGPDTVDVTGYPVVHQKQYTVVQDLFGRCHTVARALNAPVLTQAQWNRFVHRMHFKARSRLLTKASAKAVVEFLVYDAGVRKIGRRDAYLNELERMQARYAELEVERARVLVDEGARAAKDRGYVSP